MELKVIAYARNGHTDKFGIPRQSREESPILTRIVFEPEYRIAEALRGIEGFSHLWLIWGFSKNDQSPMTNDQSPITWSPTVRPPRLGGNKRMGVFATRSPFRPNPIGLSSVRLVGIENGDLIVSGADLSDGTPIYDIKPYLSFSDSHEDARNGFAEETKDYQLEVSFEESVTALNSDLNSTKYLLNTYEVCEIPSEVLEDIVYILRQDPRPAYQDDPQRVYKMDYSGWTVSFRVEGGILYIQKLEKTKQ